MMMPIVRFITMSKCLRILFLFVVLFTVAGCNRSELIDLNPKGPVSMAIEELFWLALFCMSLVLIAVFSLTIWIVSKYRASRQPSGNLSEWSEPKWLEAVLWLIPGLIVLTLAIISWRFTHRLDPHKPLDYPCKPLQIQAIALDWKWLFVYPEQNIAVINQVAFPVDCPVTFRITSGTVMNSFFIPRLAGQIYAMGGMETELHLVAKQPGRYFGENIQYSGEGFPYQHFETLALSKQDFAAWVEKAGQAQLSLDMAKYQELARPSIQHRVEFFAPVQSKLFDEVINRVKHSSAVNQSSDPGFSNSRQ